MTSNVKKRTILRVINNSVMLSSILIFSLTLRSIPFLHSNFKPYSWDGLAIVYGAQKLVETGSLHPDLIQQSGYSPIEYVRRKPYYPISQIVLAAIYNMLSLLNVNIKMYELIVYMALLFNLFIIILIYLNVSEATNNSKLGILGAFFAAVCPTITREIVWCTINILMGYILALIFIFSIIKYNKSQNRKWIFIAIISLFILPSIHFLTFIVMFLSINDSVLYLYSTNLLLLSLSSK